jgi:hypothetical protein
VQNALLESRTLQAFCDTGLTCTLPSPRLTSFRTEQRIQRDGIKVASIRSPARIFISKLRISMKFDIMRVYIKYSRKNLILIHVSSINLKL